MNENGARAVCGMFGRIAGVYDLLNRVLSLGIDRTWRRELAKLAATDGVILDLACGTLDVALACHRESPKAEIIGMDFCLPMILQGMPKLARTGNAIRPCVGNALATGLKSDTIDRVTIAFGIRNIPDRLAAFREMHRVLRPGGRVCVLEFGSAREKIWGGIYNAYLMKVLPMIGKIAGHDKAAYSYLARTVRDFPPAAELAREMALAGFENTGWKKLTGGITFLHWGEKPVTAISPASPE